MDDNGQNLSRGTNQSGGRIYNERLVLSIVRHRDGLPKAEIAKLTGLSAQTISVIMQQLEADDLIVKGEPQKGKVGQPRVPFSLNPVGAFSIGLKIGRHRSELALMNFVGEISETRQISYQYPETSQIISFVDHMTPTLIDTLKPKYRDRLVGIGIATPFELWNWGEALDAPKDIMGAWLIAVSTRERSATQQPPTLGLCSSRASRRFATTRPNLKTLHKLSGRLA